MQEQYIYQIISLVLLILVALFAFIIPDKKKKRGLSASMQALQAGDTVFTKNGLTGRVEEIGEETLILVVKPADTRLEVAKWAVEKVVPRS